MKLKNILINILLLGFCSLSLTCKSPTSPDDNIQPGNRNYIWTVDTLHYLWQSSLGGIWGSSPTNIWCGGYEDLFHYDGTTWSHWPGITCDVNTIFGFSASDVWIGGNDGKIWHFNGNSWTENFVYRPDGLTNVSICNIYGKNANDIYAVGGITYNNTTQRGFILHYDGSGWKEVYKTNYQSWFIRVRVENSTAYIFGEKIDYTSGGDTVLTETYFLYRFQNGILKQIYSGSEGMGWTMIDEIGGRVYFILSHDICRYEYTNEYFKTGEYFSNGKFVKQFSIDDPKFNYQIYGRNIKDIFATVYDGIMHWNGTDLKYLVKYSNDFMYIPVPAIFDKDVFFGVVDGLNNVVIVAHGKLIE
jgi:hypothetical protein